MDSLCQLGEESNTVCHALLEAVGRALIGFNAAMTWCADQWEESIQLKLSFPKPVLLAVAALEDIHLPRNQAELAIL